MKNKLAMGVAPAAGYAAHKMWQSYKSGHIHPVTEMSNNESDSLNYIENLSVREADTIHGQPEQNVVFDPEVYQFYNDTCAIQSQHLVLQQYGIDVSQNEMIQVAKENGWYVEGQGTPAEYVGKLLEYYGVDADASEGNNIFNLANELSQGHSVIVGVDSGELVFPENEVGEDMITGEIADHALVVVGIDTSDPDDVKVIVTDPGTGNRQWAYSQEQFLNAWKDSNCFMVTTEESPEEFNGDEFDKLQEFAGIPLSTIEQMCSINLSDSIDYIDAILDSVLDNPEGWANVLEDYPNLFYYDQDGGFHIIDPSTGDDITEVNDFIDN